LHLFYKKDYKSESNNDMTLTDFARLPLLRHLIRTVLSGRTVDDAKGINVGFLRAREVAANLKLSFDRIILWWS
jgi:hypothetical protein